MSHKISLEEIVQKLAYTWHGIPHMCEILTELEFPMFTVTHVQCNSCIRIHRISIHRGKKITDAHLYSTIIEQKAGSDGVSFLNEIIN